MNPFEWWGQHLDKNSKEVRFYLGFFATFATWWLYLFAVMSIGELAGKLVGGSAVEIAVDVALLVLTFPYMTTLTDKIVNWVVECTGEDTAT